MRIKEENMTNQEFETLKKLEKNIDEQITKVNTEKRRIFLVGICVIFFVTLYFSYLAHVFRHEIKAEEIAKIVTVNIAEIVSATTKEF